MVDVDARSFPKSTFNLFLQIDGMRSSLKAIQFMQFVANCHEYKALNHLMYKQAIVATSLDLI